MNERVEIIEQTLRELGNSVRDCQVRNADYSYGKGYSAQIDFSANDFIIKKILQRYPSDKILSEESFEDFSKGKNSIYTWIIDPLCGTTNFVNKIPFFSHSLCLIKNNKVIGAAVYDPSNDDMFFANSKNFLVNNIRFNLTKKPKLKNSLIFINVNQSNWAEERQVLQDLIASLSPPVTRRVHILESANLELAYVASGRADAYINFSDKVWDISAGEYMIEMAGGSTYVFNNGVGALIKKKGIIGAGSKKLLVEIINTLKKDTKLIDSQVNV